MQYRAFKTLRRAIFESKATTAGVCQQPLKNMFA